MFDVSWDDPTSETVAQHRQRKEREGGGSTHDSQDTSLKSVGSSDSLGPQQVQASPVIDKVGSQRKTSIARGAISLLKNANFINIERKASTQNRNKIVDSQDNITDTRRARSSDIHHQLRNSVAETVQSAHQSKDKSNRTTSSSYDLLIDNPSQTIEIQPLAEASYVTRTTEVTISHLDSVNNLNGAMNEVSISTDFDTADEFTVDIGSDIFQFPRAPGGSGYTRGGNQTPLTVQSSPSKSDNVTDGWRAPSNWGGPPGDIVAPLKLESQSRKRKARASDRNSRDGADAVPGIANPHLHIRRMKAANPKIMLERINEEWTEIADATIYKELELEKQLWMLTALKFLRKRESSVGGKVDCQEDSEFLAKSPTGKSKVLSLYESQACAQFLTASTKASEVHHLATSPLSSSIPSVFPLTVPTPNQNLPYGPLLFSSIKSLTLPSVLSSSSIPSLLKECHRLLLPSGTLCLTILDPSPNSATLGPRLRTWLDEHLSLNLEKQFRCMSPKRLLPAWLKKSGFSYEDEGAKVTIIELFAVANGEDDVAQLTTTVGRMLWREIWGGYVESDQWWWDDEEILRECEKLETRWECAIVKAVKCV